MAHILRPSTGHCRHLDPRKRDGPPGHWLWTITLLKSSETATLTILVQFGFHGVLASFALTRASRSPGTASARSQEVGRREQPASSGKHQLSGARRIA
ncbi:hypothetical protein AAFF_G00113420 [Aldrovandia affinis]|uniref:Uncharacterized protein n=1 Tax=Aldrovandia affinis TaxID=143900 RepID=A0AAD7RT50_9TELE|nr:hypothetical protein AAFF_G00113420 [Aldrovandia affinis]